MIIGLTGTIASGKGVVGRYLKNKGFCYDSLSDRVREEATKRNLPHERKILQDIGNELREKQGNAVLSKLTLNKIDQSKDWVIDGIRNPGEIEELRKTENFYLISIDAPLEIRIERIKKRDNSIEEGRKDSDPKEIKESKRLEARDRGQGEKSTGQQVEACMQMADFKIINDLTLEGLYKKIDEILNKIQK